MVQPIKLFKINVEVCRPIIATSNIIEYPYSKFLTNTAAQKNDDWEASALLKWLPPPLHIASGAPETIAIINNTGGGIEGEIWERGIGEQNEIPDEHSIILGLHLKPECVIDKILVKMLGKNQNGTTLTTINKNLEILAQTRSYFSLLIFCPPNSRVPFL